MLCVGSVVIMMVIGTDIRARHIFVNNLAIEFDFHKTFFH
jgi:hypothetical protein